MSTVIDRLGCCPHCKKSWQGEDIFQALNKLSVHALSPEKAVKALAMEYGWSEETPKRFSNVRIIEIEMPLLKFTFYECPKCSHTFNVATGEEFQNLLLARQATMLFDKQEPGY